jgi:hypothetical protein
VSWNDLFRRSDTVAVTTLLKFFKDFVPAEAKVPRTNPAFLQYCISTLEKAGMVVAKSTGFTAPQVVLLLWYIAVDFKGGLSRAARIHMRLEASEQISQCDPNSELRTRLSKLSCG